MCCHPQKSPMRKCLTMPQQNSSILRTITIATIIIVTNTIAVLSTRRNKLSHYRNHKNHKHKHKLNNSLGRAHVSTLTISCSVNPSGTTSIGS